MLSIFRAVGLLPVDQGQRAEPVPVEGQEPVKADPIEEPANENPQPLE